jgi:hypothetical protein
MTLSTWYEVCVNIDKDQGIQDSSSAATLDSAKNAIQRFRVLYPKAHMIFVRQHTRGTKPNRHAGRTGDNRPYRVLHALTVTDGTTADERRSRATEVRA